VSELLEIRGISKSFFNNPVLADVNFTVRPGEVHALIGENGAGKSTLIKIIGGIYQADGGEILWEGAPVHFPTPLHAMSCGISTVHQELSLAPNMTVAQNIYLRREIKNKLGLINWTEINRKSREVMEQVGVSMEPDQIVGQLSVGMQQVVEIAKALAIHSKVIIMDEPTSALSESEIELLFVLIRKLTKQGVSIVYISHRINEIMEISDRVSVLRDGRLIFTKPREETNPDDIISAMVGREIDTLYPEKSAEIGAEVLRCSHLRCMGAFRDVSFTLHKGEILGFYGLVGAGRTEVAKAIVGIKPLHSGEITYNGREVRFSSPKKAVRSGVCYLTEDRKSCGLFVPFTIEQNIVSSDLGRYTNSLGVMRAKPMGQEAERYIQELNILPPHANHQVQNLSGGNQQKVLLGKWMSPDPKVLIVDEPTRGVDVGAKTLIHQSLRKMADRGMAVIMISSEMPEVLGLSDRIAVFRTGQLVTILDNGQSQALQEDIMKYALS